MKANLLFYYLFRGCIKEVLVSHYGKSYAKEIMPYLCELDEVMIRMEHGILHREKTIARGDAYCDYYITGDKEKINHD